MNRVSFSGNFNFHKLFLLPVILTLLFGCTKDNGVVPEGQDGHLISYEKINSLSETLISATFSTAALKYPEISVLRDSTRYDVDIYRVVYRTTFKDEAIEASGLMAIPDAQASFPILSMQNGTNTANEQAPTENSSSLNFMLIAGMAGNGYILLLPDYPGFGESSDLVHPYFIKEPTQQAVIDFILAVKEFCDEYSSGATYNESCFLAGYSQGGWATLAALEAIEEDALFPFRIPAVSCGAGAYDLLSTTKHILRQDTFASPQYLPYYIYSHMSYGFIQGPLTNYFNEPYASEIPDLFSGEYSNNEVNARLNDTLMVLLNPAFRLDFETDPFYEVLRKDMETNSIKAWAVNTHLRFYHGNKDLDIPASESINIANEISALTQTGSAEYIEMNELDHQGGIYPWGIETVIWFNDLRHTLP